jgi:uracil-DNA glycosylase family 4
MELSPELADALRTYVEYMRDLGIYDVYVQPVTGESLELPAGQHASSPATSRGANPVIDSATAAPMHQAARATNGIGSTSAGTHPPGVTPPLRASQPPQSGIVAKDALAWDAGPISSAAGSRSGTAALGLDLRATGPLPPSLEIAIPKPVSFDLRAPLPGERLPAAARPAALSALREHIGDCTRCPLAYAGRHTIVFGDGDPSARLMFVGEGPGADEDASGVPFVGKAGQLLNNMIAAMGLTREQVYIANIVKCRPPQNRAPEPVEADTCSQFLVQQIDIVQPEIIVALGATAATYLLGVKQSLSSLRGRWHAVRGAKTVVTYHPAFLLRDPRQKGEAWKDLQMVMGELGLQPAKRS